MFAWIIGPVMDDIMVDTKADMIFPIAGFLLISLVIRGFATYLYEVGMAKVGHSLVADIQADLFKHMIRLDLKFFQENHSGSLVARVISDVQVMRSALSDSMMGIGQNVITLAILIGVMFYRDWGLALVCLTVLPIVALYVGKLGKKLRRISNHTQDAVSGMTAGLAQTFQGIRQVRSFTREAYEVQRASTILDSVRKLNIKSSRTSNLSTPINDILVGVILFAIISYGGFRVVDGQSTAGDIMSFITAFLMAYEPIRKLAKLNNNLNVGLGAADRVFDVLDTQLGIEKSKRLPALKTKKSMAVEFDNVLFEYETGVPIVDHLSFTAKEGQVTALVGPSGGGKTTVLNLIPRFFDVKDGQVLVNDQDVRKVSLTSLRESIAWVSQDITIFDDTVVANIAYGRDKVTEKDIIKAAKSAFAHDFIMDLPDGYQTRLGENGTSLSGGQRQRIALARAFLKDAPILLLDEATSALDNESERFIQESLQKLQKGRTTLVIAHRLSTIEKADHIIVIEGGKIAEQGTHSELLKKKGLYKSLKETL